MCQDGWLLENLEGALGSVSYPRFLELLHAGNHTEAFRIYVETLGAIAGKNSHTLPQVALLEYYGICRIDHFVELENCAEFQLITNIPFPYQDTNRSDAAFKQSVIRFLSDNDFLRYQLQKIYEKDLDFFSRNGLECVGLQDPG